MVSKSYENMISDYHEAMNLATNTLMEAKVIEIKLDRNDLNRKFVKYPSMIPDDDEHAYVTQMRNTAKDTRDAVSSVNKNCIGDCAEKVTKITPIGLSIPRRDNICSDEDIKKCFDELRQVLHDEYSAVKEGGEGWVKFIDTLATPEERAENYKIPSFDTVYIQFFSDKKISKVSKEDLKKAIETISDYDKKMGQIIKEADEFSYWRNKERTLLFKESEGYTFNDAAKNIAHCMYIMEMDKLFAMSIEARRLALTEACEDAHIVLYSACDHDPRNLSESTAKCDMITSVIEGQFSSIIYDPKSTIPVEKPVTESDIKVDKIVKKIADTNDDFISSKKDRLKYCKGHGIFTDIVGFSPNIISNYETLICAEQKLTDDLSQLSLESVTSMDRSINAIMRSIEEKDSSYLQKDGLRQSMASVGKALFENESIKSGYNGVSGKQLSMDDINEAVKELDKNKIKEKAEKAKQLLKDKKDAVKKNLDKAKEVVSNSDKSKAIKKVHSESAKLVSKLYDMQLNEYVNMMKADNFNAVNAITAAIREGKNMELLDKLDTLYGELKEVLK